MSKKRKVHDLSVEDLTKIPLVDLLKKSKEYMLAYGSETVENRALPDYRDGCKPVHRRILYAAYVANKHHNVSFVKSAKVVGDCMGQYHPHGESGIYGALVTIANLPEPLLDKHGNFGSDEDGPAAQRYTECRLSKYSDEYLLDPNYLAVVPVVDNYDGTCKEPIYLPSKLPNVLVTGAEGIAMGCTTLIPSFSTASVLELVKYTLLSKKKICTPELCLKFLKFKFTYGGEVSSSNDELLDYYKTGEGRLSFVPKVIIKQGKVRIISLAPRLKTSSILDTASQIDGVKKVINVTGRGCTDIAELVPPKGANKKYLLDLRKAVEKKYTTNMSCKTLVTERQDDGKVVKFKRTTVPDIVNDWIDWRLSFEVKVVNRLLSIELEKIQRWEWLIWAIDHLKLVYESLRTDDPDFFLFKKGKISRERAKYILDQVTRRLSKLSKKELLGKISTSRKLITVYKKDVSSKNAISKRVVRGLESIEW